MLRRALLLGSIAVAAACSSAEPATLTHEAYVWQRAWTGAVEASVAAAPAELTGLRVLALEVDAAGALVWPDVGLDALAGAGRPVTAVVRIEGSRPPALSLAPLLGRLAAWRRAGVDVVGVEIDHDCATARLDGYARWLAASRPPALRWSITALPTWAGAPALGRVAAAVDELVVQVHAIRAPALFDAGQARAWIEAFAAATGDAPLRVALPTYRVALGREVLAADPREVAGLVRSLERDPAPRVRGIVWFRLPVATDRAAWPAATLRAVIRGEPLTAAVAVRLVERAPDLFDVILENAGTVAAAWPAVQIDGALAGADLAGGYRRTDRRWSPPRRELAAGGRAVIGWVRGKELRVQTP